MESEGTDPLNPVRIYTDGIFDCFHYGHMRLFQQIKNKFKYVYLIVGICSDEDTTFQIGKPILKIKERAECIKNCKYCDEIILNVPWVCTIDYLNSINCKYIAHDNEPYSFNDIYDIYEPFKKCGRFIETKKTEGISTTIIIDRIIVDYDNYVERSIRKGDKWDKIGISLYKFFGVRIEILVKDVEKRKVNFPLKFYFDLWKGKVKNR